MGKKFKNYYVGGNKKKGDIVCCKTCDLEAILDTKAETGKHMLLKGKTISKYCRKDQASVLVLQHSTSWSPQYILILLFHNSHPEGFCLGCLKSSGIYLEQPGTIMTYFRNWNFTECCMCTRILFIFPKCTETTSINCCMHLQRSQSNNLGFKNACSRTSIQLYHF